MTADDYRVWTIAFTDRAGRRHMLDSDDRDGAHELGHRLEMRGYIDVQVIGPQLIEAPPGMAERIWERIAGERGVRNAALVVENRDLRLEVEAARELFNLPMREAR